MSQERSDELAQDPGELFDVVTAEGVATGISKPRGLVHRDGDWHRSIHVWIAGHNEAGEPTLLFQRRSPLKDTWGGRLDATVGGHFRAGESLEQTLRETEEEIGFEVRLEELRFLGIRICANEAQTGLLDREVQQLYLHESDQPLTAYRCHPAELAGLVRIRIADVLAFFADEIDRLTVDWIETGSNTIERIEISADAFIPNVDRYFYRVAIAAGTVLRGDRYFAV